MRVRSRTRENILFVAMLTVLLLSIGLSLCVGRYPINFKNIMIKEAQNIFYNLRLPRVIMAVLCGGALGVSGGIFQRIFKNDLASPDIIGISSSASVGAVLAIVIFGNLPFYVQIFAFLGGIIAVLLVFVIANFNRENYLFSLIIAGVIISSLCSSVVMLFKYTADPNNKLPSIEFWLMGGLHNIDSKQLYFVGALFSILLFIIYKLRWKLKVISLGDDEIKSLGINLYLIRMIFVLIATLLVTTVVSNCGVIGWVGLIAPYISRLITKRWVSMSFVIGSIILLISDTIARTATQNEIPVGILISFLGAPFLVYLLVKRGVKNNASD